MSTGRNFYLSVSNAGTKGCLENVAGDKSFSKFAEILKGKPSDYS